MHDHDPPSSSHWVTLLADYGKLPFGEDRPNTQLSRSCDANLDLAAVAEHHDRSIRKVALIAWAYVLARHAGVEDVVVAEDIGFDSPQLVPRRVQLHPTTSTTLWDQLSAQLISSPSSPTFNWDGRADSLGAYGFIRVCKSEDGPPTNREITVRSQDTPLFLTLVPTNATRATISLQFSDEAFRERDVQHILDHFTNLFKHLIHTDHSTVPQDMHLMSPDELSLLRNLPALLSTSAGSNSKAFPAPGDPLQYIYAQDLLARSVISCPSDPALVWRGSSSMPHRTYSYTDLDAASTKLSYHLRAKYGVKVGDVVLLFAEHSPFVVIAVYALLKAGAAYLPVDVDSPPNVVRHAADMVGAQLVLTLGSLTERLTRMGLGERKHAVAMDVEEPEWNGIKDKDTGEQKPLGAEELGDPDQRLAYVNLTSGSTGLPKGCMISHRSLVHWLVEATPGYGRTKETRTLQICKLQFDGIVEEIFMTHYTGGVLCISPPDAIETSLKDVINSMNVTMITFTPTRANLLDPVDVPCLEVVILTGEPLRRCARERWLDHGKKVYNAFGPTETICCFMLENPVRSSASDSTPCGLTLCPSTRVYCFDSSSFSDSQLGLAAPRIVPMGCVGEICVSGPSVGLGYFGNEEKTREVYIRDPFRSEFRMYRTGDLGRIDFEGRLTSLGRRDQQIKLNGNRIELDGVEAVLLAAQSPFITSTDVVAFRQSSRLAVFMSSKSFTGSQHGMALSLTDQEARKEAMRLLAVTKEKLPNYMVPTLWVSVEALPLTVSGKLNRKAMKTFWAELSDVERANVGRFLLPSGSALSLLGFESRMAVKPEMLKTETQLALHAIWATCLNISPEEIGLQSSLFDLGADSLGILRLATMLGKQGFRITPIQLRKLQTIQRVAEVFEPLKPSGVDVLAMSITQTASSTSSLSTSTLLTIKPMAIADDLSAHSIAIHNVDIILPATPFQKGVLLHPAEDPDAFMSTMRFIITQPIDTEHFITVLDSLRVNYPILRTVFLLTSTYSIVQVVIKQPPKIYMVDADAAADLLTIQDALPKALKEHQWGKFAFNFALATNSQGVVTELIILAHHALFDGWSIRLLLNDLMKSYSGQVSIRPSWKSFVAYANGVDVASSMQFWEDNLRGVQPTAFCRPKVLPYQGSVSQIRTFSVNLTESSRTLQVMNSTLMYTAWAVVQYLHGGVEDVVFNIVSSGRDAPVDGLLDMIGPCLTHYPLRLNFAQIRTLRDLMRTVQENLFSIHGHTVIGTGNILKAAGLPSKTTLSNVDVVFQAIDNVFEVDENEMWIRHLESSLDSATPLTIQVEPSSDHSKLSVSATYDRSAVLGEEVGFMLGRFGEVIRLALAQPDMEVTSANFLVPGELEQVVLRSSEVGSASGSQRSTWEMFLSHVRTQPDATAVVSDDGPSITYVELVSHLNIYAQRLASSQLRGDQPILIHLEKSLELIVALLACFAAGICFSLVSPDSPRARMGIIIEDIKPQLIISLVPDIASKVPIIPPPDLTRRQTPLDALPSLHTSSSFAWIMTTSGTTGRPKPIAFRRSNLDAFVNGDHSHRLNRRSLNFASVHFDAFIEDVFTTLCYGGCLCIAPDSVLRGDLLGVIRRMQAQVVSLTPTVAKLLVGENIESVETIMLGGEPYTPHLRDALLSTGIRQLQTGYGPCESTVKCLMDVITPGSSSNRPITLGSVFGDNLIVVLDDTLHPVPFGAAGELCVGGPQVSTGYIGLPEKTAQVFITLAHLDLPGVPSETRWYRTGDVVRLLPNRTLAFLGRKDRQVKIRGQRVELGEIESCLLEVAPTVLQVAVSPVIDNVGMQAMVVVVVLRDGEVLDEQTTLLKLKERVIATPTDIITVSSLPVNVSGKLDATALETLYLAHRAMTPSSTKTGGGLNDATVSEEAGMEELSEQEAMVRSFWSSVLAIEESSLKLDTAFSAVGGDSFKWMQLSQAFARAKIRVTLKKLMNAPTVRQQGLLIPIKRA